MNQVTLLDSAQPPFALAFSLLGSVVPVLDILLGYGWNWTMWPPHYLSTFVTFYVSVFVVGWTIDCVCHLIHLSRRIESKTVRFQRLTAIAHHVPFSILIIMLVRQNDHDVNSFLVVVGICEIPNLFACIRNAIKTMERVYILSTGICTVQNLVPVILIHMITDLCQALSFFVTRFVMMPWFLSAYWTAFGSGGSTQPFVWLLSLSVATINAYYSYKIPVHVWKSVQRWKARNQPYYKPISTAQIHSQVLEDATRIIIKCLP